MPPPPSELIRPPSRPPPPGTGAVELGDEIGAAGNRFDHPRDRAIGRLALQEAEHHAERLFGQIRRNTHAIGDLGYDFIHVSLLLF